jgi:hypothetical protein
MRMRWQYEGQRLEWLFHALWVFAAISVVLVTGLSLYLVWRVFV